ncbi:MAG: methyltransferase domain-containing protein [Oligoflexia bacterium]|nr:methyltransferase domain-containing protein [Oligoflexia bacterium]
MDKRSKWTPNDLLKTSQSFWTGATIHAAVKLKIFSSIGDGNGGIGCSLTEIAEKCHCNYRAMEMLLNALVATSLLEKRIINDEALYLNTSFANEYLQEQSDHYLGHIINHHHQMMKSWTLLDRAIQEGRPQREQVALSNSMEAREAFLMGMFNTATLNIPSILPAINLAEKKMLLDLGGGPGTYALNFCKQYPQLHATIFDFPTTEPFARKTIDKFCLSDRVKFVPGDFIHDSIDSTYDVVWLSHILHGEGPENAAKIVEKAVRALSPGGTIFIHEFILNDLKDGPLFPSLFSLNMLLGTESGCSYSENELKSMLVKNNIKNISLISIEGIESSIITGIK